jgi:hypothetical protein
MFSQLHMLTIAQSLKPHCDRVLVDCTVSTGHFST